MKTTTFKQERTIPVSVFLEAIDDATESYCHRNPRKSGVVNNYAGVLLSHLEGRFGREVRIYVRRRRFYRGIFSKPMIGMIVAIPVLMLLSLLG